MSVALGTLRAGLRGRQPVVWVTTPSPR